MNRFVSVAIAVAVMFSGSTASADPIVTVKAGFRIAEALIEPQFVLTQASGSDTLSVAAPPTNDTLGFATASLVSTSSDPLHWSAAGTASVSLSPTAISRPAGGQADSFFQLQLAVTEPVRYEFGGMATLFTSLPPPRTDIPAGGYSATSGFGVSVFQELPLGPAEVLRFNDIEEAQSDFRATTRIDQARTISPTFVGVLAPGQYTVNVLGGVRTIGFNAPPADPSIATSSFNFRFDFAPADASPTPEPASLLLLGTGIAGVLRFRSRLTDRGTPGARMAPRTSRG
jgi:PEP-CTERM motif